MGAMKTVAVVSITVAGLLSHACNDPASPTSPTSLPVTPVTVVYESQIYPGSTASRRLIASAAGTVSVMLTSLRPDSGEALTVGLGIPRADGGGCLLSQSVVTTPRTTPHLSVGVDPGTYCIHVSGAGTLRNEVFVSITIVHP
jgi:hypothetical protein